MRSKALQETVALIVVVLTLFVPRYIYADEQSSQSIRAQAMPGTLLYDHFGVTLALDPVQNGSIGRNADGGYTFDWDSFVPTKNTDTVDWIEGDWIGAWNDDFSDTTVDHTPAPGTPDLDYVPSGGEPYDTEAYYFDNDADNYYIAIVTSIPHAVTSGGLTDIGVVDPRDGTFGAAIRGGDLAISFFDGVGRDEGGSSTWHYNYGVDLIHENRDLYENWEGFAQRPLLRDTLLGTGLYATSADAGGSRVDGPSAGGDWYTSAANLATEGEWEHTNFDPLAAAFTGSFLGNTTVSYYEYDFGGLLENDYPTYIYEITIPRSLFGVDDKAHGEQIALQFTPGCRNDGNGAGDGTVNLVATVDDLEVGDLIWNDANDNGVYEPGQGETGINDVTVELFAEGTPITGTPVLTTTTATLNGEPGRYLFSNLPTGNYYIHVPAEEFASGAELEGHVSSTTTEVDPDDDENEDGTGLNGSGSSGGSTVGGSGDENGIDAVNPAVDGISSGVFTLAGSAEPTGEDSANIDTAPDANSNLTVDFGFFVESADSVQIVSRLWIDDGDGVQEGNEPGIESVTVTLYNITGTVVATTTTAASGYLTLTENLSPNTTYTVAVPTAEAALGGRTLTPANEGMPNDDALDSDGEIGSGMLSGFYVASVTTANSGQSTTDTDMGFLLADHGDLPAGSPVEVSANGPRHVISPSLTMLSPTVWLGTNQPDYESDGMPHSSALGDNAAGNVASDEDGFFRTTSLMPGGTTQTYIQVNGTASSADVALFIDWDGDGDFVTVEGDECYFYNDVSTGSAGSPNTISQSLNVPMAQNANARVRLRVYDAATGSSCADVAPTGSVVDGEVEDWLMTMEATAVSVSAQSAETSSAYTVFLMLLALSLLTRRTTRTP